MLCYVNKTENTGRRFGGGEILLLSTAKLVFYLSERNRVVLIRAILALIVL